MSSAKIKRLIANSHSRIMQILKKPSAKDQGAKFDLTDAKTAETINNNGERATHLRRNDSYIAHLSVYHFAIPFCRGLNVLDAGSGAGYGSAYLAENGAKQVIGIELDDDAVQFSKAAFGQGANLSYKQMNLENIHGFEENEFDVIFSSNVLEHVPDVHAFFSEATRILKPYGKLILAVPPILGDIRHITANLSNHYHVNIWSAQQWHHTLQQYFYQVNPYSHRYIGKKVFNLANKSEESKASAADFEFMEISGPDKKQSTLSSTFVASNPYKPANDIDRGIIDYSFNVNSPDLVRYDNQGILCSDVLYSTQTTVGRLKTGIKYCQTFICNQNDLSGIALNIATYRKQIDSVLRFTLIGSQKRVIREIEKNSQEIPDNSFYPFLFSPIAESKGKRYSFCIETIADKGETVTLWTDNQVRNACTRNEVPVEFGLLYKCCFRPTAEYSHPIEHQQLT